MSLLPKVALTQCSAVLFSSLAFDACTAVHITLSFLFSQPEGQNSPVSLMGPHAHLNWDVFIYRLYTCVCANVFVLTCWRGSGYLSYRCGENSAWKIVTSKTYLHVVTVLYCIYFFKKKSFKQKVPILLFWWSRVLNCKSWNILRR